MGLDDKSKEIKFRTTEHKNHKKTHHLDAKKYATAPPQQQQENKKQNPRNQQSDNSNNSACNSNNSGNNLDKKIFVSLISQAEYMKRHLFIKSAVDRPVLRYQVKKVSLRNYTPKTINQDINMGMWI